MKIYAKIKFKLLSYLKKRVHIPTYEFKRSEIERYRKIYDPKVLVETGTFMGDTVEHLKRTFTFVYSIELSEEFAVKAKKKFEDDKNVKIIQGDSGIVLRELVLEIDQPTLFWLDGHYSSEFYFEDQYFKTAKGEKNTPILNELSNILANRHNHIILIDDARLFIGKDDYPSISELQKLVKNTKYELTLKNDIIYILPKTTLN
jgi:hypothetical protein